MLGLEPNKSSDKQLSELPFLRAPHGDANLRLVSDEKALALLAEKGSWRHYPAYTKRAAARVGAKSSYCAVFRGDTAIAIANLRTKHLPLGLGASSLVSHGPALLRRREHWPDDLSMTLTLLFQHAAATRQEIRIDPDPVWFLEPSLAQEFDLLPSERGSAAYRTILLGLDGGPEAVRARLKSKWRGKLRQAERNGLRVERSDRPSDIVAIKPLLNDLIARKGFAIDHNPEFFAKVASDCIGAEKMLAHLVYKGDELVSAHIGAFSGETAVYLLGATSRHGMDLRAAHLAQMHAITAAWEFGQRYYDTGGIDPEGNPGVYEFKKSMGGTDLQTAPVGIISPSGLNGFMLGAARRAYKAFKR